MNLKTTLRACLVASAALAPVLEPVQAYNVTPCNGKPHGGLHSNITMRIDRCYTAANNTNENAVIDYAVAEWNKISGVHNRFATTSGDSSCSIVVNDGVSELALVPANHPLLAQANRAGVTKTVVNACASPYDSTRNGRVVEADVLVSEATVLTPLDSLDVRTGGRQLLMHELGHVLGANHVTNKPALMESIISAKMARHSVIGLNSDRAESYFPDDVQMASVYHSDGGAGLIDPAVSAWHWDTATAPAATRRIYPGTSARPVCRGATTTVRYSNGNLGKAGLAQANQVKMQILLSDNAQISTTDRVVSEFTFWGAQGFFGSSTRTITVPANLPLGTYYVGVLVDPDQVASEQEEGNNSTPLGLRLNVNC